MKGDKDHPHSHGFICPKARAIKEMIYHPERITTPLVRTGKKGSGTFEKASWDEALSIVAENLLSVKKKLKIKIPTTNSKGKNGNKTARRNVCARSA